MSKQNSRASSKRGSVGGIMIDTQVKDILEKFNVKNKSPFLPQKAYRSLIERNISVINDEKSL
ncbi:hypothetical protein P3339_22395 [Microbulbifer sp. MLAF003]|uniref:hypothetical protein n=1 Tax=Microbulbifer sp. MLAF003 TaxID=3032582 RepID=UPI0024AC8E2D|nr:hypothetical protein [Microbulbifer sp. MLAF003]WHI51113.1 hypothetical protein P3339_22395 [Microbulbifer sp. MLAF003]